MALKTLHHHLIRVVAPSFYHLMACIQYQAGDKRKKDAGLFSIKSLGQKTAELGLIIFPAFRGKMLTPRQCQTLLDVTKLQGFMYVIIGTYLTSMKKFCQRFKFDHLFIKNNKHWFNKELTPEWIISPT